MSYVDPDYETKKEFKAAVATGAKHRTYSPGPFGTTQNGSDCIEGSHYPKPHSWYAAVEVRGGIVVKVKS